MFFANSRFRFRILVRSITISSGLYLVWFIIQVYVGGQEAVKEISSRLQLVTTHLTEFTNKQYVAVLAFTELAKALSKLLLPFVFDLVLVGTKIWTELLPREVKYASIIGSVVLYALYSFRWARHVAFLPTAVGLYVLSEQMQLQDDFLIQYLIPCLSVYYPVLESLRAFTSKRNSLCAAWLHYWSLCPLTVFGIATWRQHLIKHLQQITVGTAAERASRSGSAVSPTIGSSSSSQTLLHQSLKPITLILIYLVFWQGSDYAFYLLQDLLKRVSGLLLRFDLFKWIKRKVALVVSKLYAFVSSRTAVPAEEKTLQMKLVEKLATSSSSLGENNQQNSSSSASTTGSDGGAPGGANNYFAAATGGTTSRAEADEQKDNRSPRRDENGINQASGGGAPSPSSAFASLKTRIFLKLLSLGSNTLWLTVVIAGVTFLVMYRLLSFVSKSIVWVWFLYELSSTAQQSSHHRADPNVRKKLAMALLFLSADYLFRQKWFLVPAFVIDLIRIPLLVVFNLFGEQILDFLLASCMSSAFIQRNLVIGNSRPTSPGDTDSREEEGGEEGGDAETDGVVISPTSSTLRRNNFREEDDADSTTSPVAAEPAGVLDAGKGNINSPQLDSPVVVASVPKKADQAAEGTEGIEGALEEHREEETSVAASDLRQRR
ncbi:unnamed protein product [Amoebophrya sp. A120]|nr:unnamed protein product [Amoebophrya sp. A120]|eukprot:GSA120T00009843001.1